MSALQTSNAAPEAKPGSERRATLRAVPKQATQLSQLPFIFFIAILLGGGLAGVLVLSTTIQTNSVELQALQSQESDLSYQEAALVAEAQKLRSSQNLADEAWALGMRPNPNPAFIKMPGGEIEGVPAPVTGDELPGIVPPATSAETPAATSSAEPSASPEAESSIDESQAADQPTQQPSPEPEETP